MRCSLQDIFVQHFPAYAATRQLHPRQLRAAQAISQCYTPALGAHELRCPQAHYQRLQSHACRHRSCPRCVEPARSRWIAAQLDRLLPCPHFHCVFTVPHELLALWAYNRAAMTQLLFESARASLLQIMADPRRLGVLPGVLMTLHTWGRTLSHHPHLHCLVTAGGLDADGGWKHCRSHIPVSALPLKRLFRGKFLGLLGAMLSRQRLALPPEQDHHYWRSVIRQLYRKDFNVEVCDVYEHGRGVALYLARYVKGGPLPKERELRSDAARVSFEYTDHRDQRRKTHTLPVQQFIERILWHAPPKGQHLTRYAGLYTTPLRQRYEQAELALREQRPALWPRPAATPQSPPPLPPEPPRCPQCGEFLLRLLRLRTHHLGEFSLAPAPQQHEARLTAARAPPRRCPTLRSS
jgi:Putative transposase/Transposase zinc-binding domain